MLSPQNKRRLCLGERKRGFTLWLAELFCARSFVCEIGHGSRSCLNVGIVSCAGSSSLFMVAIGCSCGKYTVRYCVCLKSLFSVCDVKTCCHAITLPFNVQKEIKMVITLFKGYTWKYNDSCNCQKKFHIGLLMNKMVVYFWLQPGCKFLHNFVYKHNKNSNYWSFTKFLKINIS